MGNFMLAVLSGVVASLIWYILSSLNHLNGRSRIQYLLNTMVNTNKKYLHSLEYNDYSTAIMQCDKLMNIIQEIYFNISYLAFLPKKRKIILTILYQLLVPLTRFKDIEIGQNNKINEMISCCNDYKLKNFIKINYDDENCDFLSNLQIKFLLEIVKRNKIKSLMLSFGNDIFNPNCTMKLNKLCKNLVSEEYCLNETNIDFYMSSKTYKKDEYDSIIDKLI